jgi:PAS domain S-box-containing protein
MLWLYLLAVVTILVIVLRRVLRRQKPLDDELYSKKVAIEHVQSGIAWIRGDGTFGSVNQSFAQTLNAAPEKIVGQEWFKMFPVEEHQRVRDLYSQMLLMGVCSWDGAGRRMDESHVWLNVKLVAAHDRKMRFVGHFCLVEDRTRERELEEKVVRLAGAAARPVSQKLEAILNDSRAQGKSETCHH